MEIQANRLTNGASAAAQAPEPQRNAAISSDFETFLRMLTTQMENQDPLNPIESADFAVQLATFSGVEQQVRTNDLLAEMVRAQGGSDLATFASWVGTDVRTTARMEFNGSPVMLYPETPPDARSAVLIVRDAAGDVVARAPVPVPAEPFEWAGVRENGAPLPPGLYSFQLEGYAGDQLTGFGDVAHYARVTEVRLERGAAMLVLPGDQSVSPNDVTAVRAQPSP